MPDDLFKEDEAQGDFDELCNSDELDFCATNPLKFEQPGVEDCLLLAKGKVLLVVYPFFCIILLLYHIIRSHCACTDLRSGIRVRTTHQSLTLPLCR
jgi:hypothetical protein